MTWRMRGWAGLVAAGLLASCGGTEEPEPADETPAADLGLGEVDDMGIKADGWGAATTCKPIPNVPVLARPSITVSLDGLTLHLRDLGGTYDRVFPIGPGSIDSRGRSLTPVGNFTTGRNTTEAPDSGWTYYYPCKIWWTDPDNGQKSPVFAGLPFIRLEGPPSSAYGIHGPIDAYKGPTGGILRRGYVSHGCIRMAAEDIVEVFARIRGKSRTPVKVQQEIERDALGRAVDVPERWIGQECERDSDCNYAGGVCKKNPYGHGWCTKACTSSCPDKTGYQTTRCVKDGTAGTCAMTGTKVNNYCKGHYGRVQKSVALAGRTGSANVCWPGTPGQLGDPCLTPAECAGVAAGARVCEPSGLANLGFCSQACTGLCPGTLICTQLQSNKRCVETCSSQDQCSAGLACEDGVTRVAGGTRTACVPGDD